MSVKVYKITSSHLNGEFYLTFENGVFSHFQAELKKPFPSEMLWQDIRKRMPQYEKDLFELTDNQSLLSVKELAAKSVKDKVILFCKYFKHYRHCNYTPTTLEKANLKNVPVNDQLLTAFFSEPAPWFVQNNYTLTNYIKRINNIKDLAKNGQYQKPRFPDYYDAKFEANIGDNPAELTAYHQHLRSKGWKRKMIGMVEKWVKDL